jgi:hypothetical protein
MFERHLKPQIDMTRKEPLHHFNITVKMPRLENKIRLLKLQKKNIKLLAKAINQYYLRYLSRNTKTQESME